jgi:hypothetical protein
MIKRSTWIVILVLVLISALAWYLNQPDNALEKIGAGTPTPSVTIAPIFYLIETSDGTLTSITVTKPSGESATLSSVGGVWMVTSPYEGLADQNTAAQFVSGASSIRITATLDQHPEPAVIGFDTPTLIEFTFAEGKTKIVTIGKSTPTETGYYIQIDDRAIQVAEKYTLDLLIDLAVTPPFMFTATPSPTATETPAVVETNASGTPATLATSLPGATATP